YEIREIGNINKAREINETGEVNKSNESGEVPVNETNELAETDRSSEDEPGKVNEESNSYFNELCLNGENTGTLGVILIKVSDSFRDFAHAETKIRQYAEFKGFNIQLGRSTIVGTEMRKRTIEYQNSGPFKARNFENPGTSVKQEDTHNHEMSIEALQFEKLK
ncbi:25126_t:CDS:2, partial [Gigaspora rosea]